MVLGELWADDADAYTGNAWFPTIEETARQRSAVRTVYFACAPTFQ